MKLLIVIFCLLVSSCGGIVQDKKPSSIDMNHKRIETELCGEHAVGLNGCLLKDGIVSGEMSVYSPVESKFQMNGCGVDKEIILGSGWTTFQNTELLGSVLKEDCKIEMYQFLSFPDKEKLTFPVRGMSGSVFFGKCSFECSYSAQQERFGEIVSISIFGTKGNSGKYQVQTCGTTVGPLDFDKEVSVDIDTSKIPQNCLIGSAVKSVNKYKAFYDLSVYKQETILLASPSIQKGSFGKFSVVGDDSVAISDVDGVVKVGGKFNYKPKPEGNWIKFYTSQGRSLVVYVNQNGAIEWMQ